MTEQELLELFKKADVNLYNKFIKAPASTQHHGAKEGGLLEHSRNVMNNLKSWREKHLTSELTNDDCIICGILHDLCKADLYTKLPTGKYVYDREIVKHHAKRSVELINKLGITLTTQQRCMILLHMSSWSNEEDFAALNDDDLEWLMYPKHIQLVQAINWSDMKACEDERNQG